jgi:sulfate/thiosulfate transport system permease protein
VSAPAASAAAVPSRPRAVSLPGGAALGRGIAVLFFSFIVLLPLAAVVSKAFHGGFDAFWSAVTDREAMSALKLTLVLSIVVTLVNAVMGTLIAWVLVRDEFRGKKIVNSVIDLPFALPTIVAGLTLLALYGPRGPAPFNIAYTRIGVAAALLFVTLPFVVRAVQPVLLTLERDTEEAAESLGATPWVTFRRVILPSLTPAILSGSALAFARALGEFGSIVLIAGNLPFKTEMASVFIYGSIQSDDLPAAAAVSVVLLLLALVVLGLIAGLDRWGRRHEG